MESSIIANLESRIEPVSKEKRMQLSISPKFQQWYAAITKDPAAWDGIYAGKSRENTEAARELVAALNRRANIEVATELRRYFSTSYAISEEAMHPVVDSDLVQMLEPIREQMDRFFGCSTSEVGIRLECAFNSSYSPEKPEIRISRIPLSGDRNRIRFAIFHEYCHHVEFCTCTPKLWIKQMVVGEGLADCAGMAGAILYGAANNNQEIENRIRQMFHRRLEGFREFYAENRFESYTTFRDISYTIGTTAFLVAEAIHGKEIYREIIRSANPAEYLIKKLN